MAIPKNILKHLESTKAKCAPLEHKVVYTAYDAAQTMKKKMTAIAKPTSPSAKRTTGKPRYPEFMNIAGSIIPLLLILSNIKIIFITMPQISTITIAASASAKKSVRTNVCE